MIISPYASAVIGRYGLNSKSDVVQNVLFSLLMHDNISVFRSFVDERNSV